MPRKLIAKGSQTQLALHARVWRFIRECPWASLSLTAGSIVIAIGGALPGLSPHGGWAWVTSPDGELVIVGTIICAVASGAVWLREPGRQHLARLLGEAHDRIALLEDQANKQETLNQSLLRQYLKRVFDDLQLGATERISLYSHDGRGFVPLARWAENPNFRNFSRRLYPDYEGCIGEAYRSGEHFVNDLPDPAANVLMYYNALKTRYAMERKTAKALAMKSRALAGFRIDDHHGDFLAMIVFESLRTDILVYDDLKALMVKAKPLLVMFMEHLRPTLPVPASVHEQGY